ncbi:hypothetical protein MA04_03075 [Alcanivorax balearicus MACL04]|uniref:Uncharacterized protein n=1 Tax=Alloalcanivorax balearicus MACL04 TaxID=1177182 RepID=A0ABT2R1W7_9GAMM|nr:hypothetical protein [Alloalcanivorax balearicus]MCU5783775.1 hypothetical protein [Alloalcanivorax balearicus MACL04]
MNKKPLYLFFVIFALMFFASMALMLFADRTLYLAPIIGLAGMIWALLRLRGVTRIGGITIGRDD